MTITDCPNCGGTHYGSFKCPYIEAPCVICGTATILACSDCAIDSGGKESVHVCNKSSCRDEHEKKHPQVIAAQRPPASDLSREWRETGHNYLAMGGKRYIAIGTMLIEAADTCDRLERDNSQLRDRAKTVNLDLIEAQDYEITKLRKEQRHLTDEVKALAKTLEREEHENRALKADNAKLRELLATAREHLNLYPFEPTMKVVAAIDEALKVKS